MTTPDHERWSELRREVDELLLGGPRTLRRGDVAAEAGIPLERTARLWSALGFPRVPDDVAAFTAADTEALDLVRALFDPGTGRVAERGAAADGDGAVDENEALAIARTLGQSMARLAEWQSELLRRSVVARGTPVEPEAVVDAVRTLLPVLEGLQAYTWRRHLAATAERMLSTLATAEPGAGEPEAGERATTAVGFADVVGFTALSRRVDADELRALLERFERVSTDVVSRHGGRIVKTLGDEILFVCPDVACALEIAFDLHDEVPDVPSDGGRPRLALRIGLAHGEVLPRYGDVYGPTVNIASRLTSHARPGTTLLDDDMTAAVRDRDLPVELRSVPALRVRGYRHLTPHVVRRA